MISQKGHEVKLLNIHYVPSINSKKGIIKVADIFYSSGDNKVNKNLLSMNRFTKIGEELYANWLKNTQSSELG